MWISSRIRYQSDSRRASGLAEYLAETGWRTIIRRPSSSSSSLRVKIWSGQVPSPWTSTAGGATRPLPVGSEYSIATRGVRRTL
jgi:hypothetical protein